MTTQRKAKPAQMGRPPKDPKFVRVDFPIRIPQWMADEVDSLRKKNGWSRADFVVHALLETYSMEKPDA